MFVSKIASEFYLSFFLVNSIKTDKKKEVAGHSCLCETCNGGTNWRSRKHIPRWSLDGVCYWDRRNVHSCSCRLNVGAWYSRMIYGGDYDVESDPYRLKRLSTREWGSVLTFQIYTPEYEWLEPANHPFEIRKIIWTKPSCVPCEFSGEENRLERHRNIGARKVSTLPRCSQSRRSGAWMGIIFPYLKRCNSDH